MRGAPTGGASITTANEAAKARAASLPSGLSYSARQDAWWAQPFTVVVVLTGFLAYSFWRMFENANYESGNLLSPFYSPNLPHLVPMLPWDLLPIWVSPAMLILWAPAGFRLTCYYYRKAYYRSFAFDPPGCAVQDPHSENYMGEARFPFTLQNLHRYLLYAATLVVVFLWVDVVLSVLFEDGFGVSVGTLVLFVNATLLTAYSFSCHSLRHIVGGRLDCFSCSLNEKVQYKSWRLVTRLNENHMMWAWISLFGVALADLYVRLVAAGIFDNARLI